MKIDTAKNLKSTQNILMTLINHRGRVGEKHSGNKKNQLKLIRELKKIVS